MSRLGLFIENPYKLRTLAGRLLGSRRRARLARDLSGAVRLPEVFGHDPARSLRERQQPAFHFSRAGIARIISTTPEAERNQLLTAAGELVVGRFAFRGSAPVTFGDEIDWRFSEGVDPDWRRDLNRLDWLNTLLLATHYSGMPKYAAKAASALLRWRRENPPGSEPWLDTFETAQRINTLCWLLFLGRELNSFSDNALTAALALIEAHARWTLATIEYKTPNNHLLVEAVRLAEFGTLFPEYAAAKKCLARGLALVEREIKRQVSKDGVHLEGSIFYHRIVLEALLELVSLAHADGVELPNVIPERCRLMLRFLRAVRRPGGGFPQFGDGAASDIFLRYNLVTAGRKLLGVGTAGGACNIRTLWLLDGEPPHVSEKGVPRRTGVWREGGYAVLFHRQGEGGSHLVFDCGPFGMTAAPGHGHADCLSLELWIHGLSIVVDSGTYTYSDERWRNALRGTRAHNTVVIDGEDQTPLRGIFSTGTHARSRIIHGVTGERLRLVDAAHYGYARRLGVVHRRTVIELAGDGWLVIDRLTGNGSHSAELLWHLHPVLSLELRGNEAIARREGATALDLRWLADFPLEAAIRCGETDPPFGWVSFEAGVKEPAPVLTLTGEFSSPALVATLLVRPSEVRKVVRLDMADARGGKAITCDIGEARHTILLAGRTGVDFDGWRTDAATTVIRRGESGTSLIIAGGRSLESRDRTLISLPRTTSGLACESTDRVLALTGDCPLPLWTALEGFDKALLNGAEVPVKVSETGVIIGK